MAVERTLSIVKPDGVAKNVIGDVYSRFEKAGLRIVAARMLHLTRAQAEGFYAVHRERPFFRDLVDFMISGPVLVQVLQGENAIAKNRELMRRNLGLARLNALFFPTLQSIIGAGFAMASNLHVLKHIPQRTHLS